MHRFRNSDHILLFRTKSSFSLKHHFSKRKKKFLDLFFSAYTSYLFHIFSSVFSKSSIFLSSFFSLIVFQQSKFQVSLSLHFAHLRVIVFKYIITHHHYKSLSVLLCVCVFVMFTYELPPPLHNWSSLCVLQREDHTIGRPQDHFL